MSPQCALCGSTENHALYDNGSLCRKTASTNPCNPCRKLAELSAQIIKVKQTLSEIQKEAQRLKSEMNFCHDRLIHRLPPEISSEIFQLSIPNEIIDVGLHRTYATSTPLVLSSVCQKWREIAHTTPQLWTSVPLRLGIKNHCSLPQLAQEWISRSGQLLLSINLFFDPSQSASPTILRPLITTINQYSTRWEYLNYQGPSSALSDLVGDSQGAPHLQTLKLCPCQSGFDGWSRFKLDNFKPTPTTLEMSAVRLKSVVIQWNNITHVQARQLFVDECLEIFRKTPKLTHCLLQHLPPGHHFPMPQSPILHRTLQVLELRQLVLPHHPDNILKNVTLPSLKSYKIDLQGYRLETESLISLFLRSSCSLQMLSLIDVNLYDEDLVALFRVMPELHHLELALSLRCGADTTEHIFRHFSSPFIVASGDTETRQAFLPQLQSMIFRGMAFVDWKLVADIFGSPSDIHNPRRRPLQSVSLNLYPVRVGLYRNDDPIIIDKDSLSRMLLLVEHGVELKITDMSSVKDVIQQSIEFHAHDSA
ncbi:hypothetical protein BDZ97DRAFT_1011334 [Flammula alnicola]|nr:hypothetical protein BDZ97DRAFT_1011334 [Flammula alnicola]